MAGCSISHADVSSKVDAQSTDCSLDRAEFVLTVLHEVIRNIMENLPAQSLNICARVCKRWYEIVKKVKKSRQKHMWLLYQGDKANEDIHDEIGAKFPGLPSEPTSAVLFCSLTLYEKTVSVPSRSTQGNARSSRATKKEKVKAVDYLQRMLPPHCQITGVVADGIVGTSSDLKIVREMEGLPGAACLMFPPMTGVDVYTFFAGTHLEEKLDGVHCILGPEPDDNGQVAAGGAVREGAAGRPGPDSGTARTLREITGIPEGKEPRVILLFYTEHFYYINADVGYALLKHYDRLVVAGGYVDNLLPEDDEDRDSDSESDETILMGVAFCGDNIKMASVVLRSAVRTPKDVETTLRKLKASGVPEANSVGFMFACIGRGHSYYDDQHNVEADAFHKLFPNTPLFGFFGNGEVGFDYLPDYSRPDGHRDFSVMGQAVEGSPYVWEAPEIHHSYTTIFVLMSLGQPAR